ncbi:putative Fe-S protein YdhL (DUF1289 family) [Neorhizobium galegae]|uniref:DUF1289 domain-containing protein n=1 Tax=Neorhizobium galegae TaxID=399 RepID=UPI001AE29F3E|nr:DUF1289 domain-containing protein [Neorhizobium galegae]MBP2549660.1 putative Fe-S protein YdhL (DUF1289 family) [Neorhizobium galegae]
MISPCIRVCSLDETTGLCTGCARSLDEIGGWVTFTEHERRDIMAALPARLASLALTAVQGAPSTGRNGHAS